MYLNWGRSPYLVSFLAKYLSCLKKAELTYPHDVVDLKCRQNVILSMIEECFRSKCLHSAVYIPLVLSVPADEITDEKYLGWASKSAPDPKSDHNNAIRDPDMFPEEQDAVSSATLVPLLPDSVLGGCLEHNTHGILTIPQVYCIQYIK